MRAPVTFSASCWAWLDCAMFRGMSVLLRSQPRGFRTALALFAVWLAAAVHAGELPGGDRFGTALALSGDLALVGRSASRPGAAVNSGAALLFVRESGVWRYERTFESDEPSSGDGFGSAVALSGETAVMLGSRGQTIHIWAREAGAWRRTTLFDSSDPIDAIALDGDTLAIGLGSHDNGRGAIRLYSRMGPDWQPGALLTAANGTPGDRLGTSIALRGDRLVAGASNRQGGGAAYVFERENGAWIESAQLLAEANPPAFLFGFAVAVEGDRIGVTALRRRQGNTELAGSGFVFERSGAGWQRSAQLNAPDAESNDLFGWSIGLSGTTAIIGSYFDTDTQLNEGAAYVFPAFDVVPVPSQKLHGMPSRPMDIFGSAIAFEGDTLWIGAPGFQNRSFGTAYALQRSGAVFGSVQRFVDPLIFSNGFEPAPVTAPTVAGSRPQDP